MCVTSSSPKILICTQREQRISRKAENDRTVRVNGKAFFLPVEKAIQTGRRQVQIQDFSCNSMCVTLNQN